MKQFLSRVFVVCLFASSSFGSEIDLASDTAWTLRCDNGPARAIKVPGGGWNSDQQSPRIQVMRDVKDFVVYERTITVPSVYPEQAVWLRFGAVAHGCEVFLGGKKVGEHHGPQVAFDIDLTSAVVAGKEQVLQVKAFHRRHYFKPGEKKTAEIAVGWDYPDGDDKDSCAEAKAWSNWHGNSKVAYGIGRSIKLAILPAVHVGEVFVRPSVSKKQLTCDVWLRNETDKERTVTLGATLSSWNKRDWNYPSLPSTAATIPARGVVKVTLGPVPWTLGPESYWWPNIPFREDYRAQLHFLSFTLSENKTVGDKQSMRFGFVEHSEGPFYYMVNGVRVTGISDATAEGGLSYYDSYGSAAAFLPPTKDRTGCPETWRKYMRIGININRLHCSPPTEYMMEAADEVGFMLIPEAPIWGNNLSRYNPQYTPQTYHDMGVACRNHPCIARYSLSNEVREPRQTLKSAWPWRAAIDDLRTVDDLHPMVFELHNQGRGQVDGVNGGHAWIMEHYQNIREKVGEGKGIRGMGEHFWKQNGIGAFAIGARTLRVNDWCYMAGWCWINYWPNFLEGMNHNLHAWKPQNHADRKDGVDGWGSPIVEFFQRSAHPYLIQDLGLLKENPGEPKGLGNGKIRWPYNLPTVLAGSVVERRIEVFNGGLAGNQLTLHWSAHWDTPTGPVALEGGERPLEIEPGFHTTTTISFTAPKIEDAQRELYLVLESRMAGTTIFRSDETCLNVISRKAEPVAKFLGTDDKTRGDWQGKYGTDGHELVAKETKLPGYAKFNWKTGKLWTYAAATDDQRALAYFANPPTGKDRIAAGRYADELVFDLDVGPTPRRMSIYHLDYDKKSRCQRITITDAITGAKLDEREIDNFADGRYQSWQIQGNVRVTIHKITGANATVAGIFLDPAEK